MNLKSGLYYIKLENNKTLICYYDSIENIWQNARNECIGIDDMLSGVKIIYAYLYTIYSIEYIIDIIKKPYILVKINNCIKEDMFNLYILDTINKLIHSKYEIINLNTFRKLINSELCEHKEQPLLYLYIINNNNYIYYLKRLIQKQNEIKYTC